MDLTLDGNAVHFHHRAAQPGKPTLLLIHGGGLDHAAWLPPLERLAACGSGLGFMAPDLPAHGRSGGAPLADIESMATWVLRLLDAMQVDTVTLVGHSMGSLVALECAGRDGIGVAAGKPARIARIALLGTAFPMQVSAALLEACANDEPGAQAMVNGWSHAVPRPGEEEISAPLAAVMAHNLAIMQGQRRGVLHADLLACSRYTAGLQRAAQLRCPALLLLGEKDRMTPPRGAQELAKAIRGAQVVTLAGTGHNMMAEQADTVADALLN